MNYNKIVITPVEDFVESFEVIALPLECDFTVVPLEGVTVLSWSAPITVDNPQSQSYLKQAYKNKTKLNITVYLESTDRDFVFHLMTDGKISGYSEIYTQEDLSYACRFLCTSCTLNTMHGELMAISDD